jgi:tetratricopeptide (TPR) repeat protein
MLCERAFAASLLGRQEESEALMNEGRSLGRKEPMAAVRCLRNSAFIAQNTNDPEAALEYAQQAQARLKDYPVPKPDMEAQILADIGAAYYLAGDNGAAERYYAQAMDGLTKLGIGDSPGAFFLRNNWGAASNASGDPRRALEQFDAAIEIATERSIGGEPPPYLLLNRASALSALARYDEAFPAYEVALAAAEKSGNAVIRIGTHAYRAHTYAILGDLGHARQDLAVVAPAIGTDVPADSVPAMMFLLAEGRVNAADGRSPEAIAGFTKIIAFFDGRQQTVAPLARVLIARGEAHLAAGDRVAATADAQRALEVSRKLQGDKPYSSLTGLSLLLAARIAESRGDRAAAKARAAEAAPQLAETLGPGHPDSRRAALML